MKVECESKTNSGYLEYDAEKREENTPIITDALSYKEYFNTLEIILNWAVFYTACAMKWTLNEAKKDGLGDNLENFNPNNWVNNPYEDKVEVTDPVEDPQSKKQLAQEKKQANEIHLSSWFYIVAISTPLSVTIFLPKIMKTLKKEKEIAHT